MAGYYLSKGENISGSDLAPSEITDSLKKLGADIIIGKHKGANIKSGIDLVVYSPAVEPNNPELKMAKELGIATQSYPEALGGLTKKHFTIAVSGTHGKSTTTAMIALILIKAGLDPNVIVGTKLKELGGFNFRAGKSKYLVIEADEWQASFLNYWPKIIVLTNVEKEHMDYYKSENHILNTYKEYVGHLPKEGTLVVNGEDKNIKKIMSENWQFRIVNFQSSREKDAPVLRQVLKIPGEHNISNALAALTAARLLKVSDEDSLGALSEYKGAWRRFEIKETKIAGKNITFISDYGHHPTEVRVTLAAARQKFPKKEIWCVFQPHQYQRTFYLFNDFVKVFRNAPIDKIILADIYSVAGREKKSIKLKVNSKKLVKGINKSHILYLQKRKISAYLKKNIKSGAVLIVMGAGDIYKLTENLN